MRLFLRPLFGLGPLLVLACGGAVHAQPPPPESPFLSASPAVSASHAQSSEPYQLSAIGVVADKTFVSIYEAAEKRSRWIAVGDSLGDLHVVSCDIEAEQAVITIAGETRTLTLPKPAVTTAAVTPATRAAELPVATPSAAPADGAPAAAATPTEEDQAREARMLVTDLLEIGMQQRKAYEDAQKQAAAGRSGEKPAETNAN